MCGTKGGCNSDAKNYNLRMALSISDYHLYSGATTTYIVIMKKNYA